MTGRSTRSTPGSGSPTFAAGRTSSSATRPSSTRLLHHHRQRGDERPERTVGIDLRGGSTLGAGVCIATRFECSDRQRRRVVESRPRRGRPQRVRERGISFAEAGRASERPSTRLSQPTSSVATPRRLPGLNGTRSLWAWPADPDGPYSSHGGSSSPPPKPSTTRTRGRASTGAPCSRPTGRSSGTG